MALDMRRLIFESLSQRYFAAGFTSYASFVRSGC